MSAMITVDIYDEDGLVPNMAALDAALFHIEANPGDWNQREWRCGTGGCLAHHLAAMHGAEWLLPDEEDEEIESYRQSAVTLAHMSGRGVAEGYFLDPAGHVTRWKAEDVVTPDGNVMPVAEFARQVAGLTMDEAVALFDAKNTLPNLQAWVAMLRAKANSRSTHPAAGPQSPSCGTGRRALARAQDRWGSSHAM